MSKVNGPIQGCHYLYMYYLGIVFAKNRKYIFRKKVDNLVDILSTIARRLLETPLATLIKLE